MLELIVTSTLNGVLYGMLLFLMASGLTVIFSMLGVLNFAHASFYMLGAFFGFQISRWFGFWTGLLVAPMLAGLIGAAIERYGLRHVHKNGHVAELLFTFGLAFVIEVVVEIIWGKSPVDYRVPRLLDFPAFTIFSTNYPAFKMFMLLASVAIFLALLIALKKARVGLIVQAALTHPHMVGHLGHNVDRIFMMVFGVGTALAAVAGVIPGPALQTQSNMAEQLGPILFVVVVVGGLGSLQGAFIASLLIALVQTFAVSMNGSLASIFGPLGPGNTQPLLADIWNVTIAQIAPIIPYLLMIVILLFRPKGLLGTRESYLLLALSDLTPVWQLYFGLFFISVVMFAPGGITGLLMKHRPLVRAGTLFTVLRAYLVALIPTLTMIAGLILAIEIVAQHTVNASEDPNMKAFGVRFNAASPLIWLLAVALVIGGFVVARHSWRWVGKAWDEALIAAREKGFYA